METLYYTNPSVVMRRLLFSYDYETHLMAASIHYFGGKCRCRYNVYPITCLLLLLIWMLCEHFVKFIDTSSCQMFGPCLAEVLLRDNVAVFYTVLIHQSISWQLQTSFTWSITLLYSNFCASSRFLSISIKVVVGFGIVR